MLAGSARLPRCCLLASASGASLSPSTMMILKEKKERERSGRAVRGRPKTLESKKKKKKIATSIIDYATHYATSYQANWFSTPLD